MLAAGERPEDILAAVATVVEPLAGGHCAFLAVDHDGATHTLAAPSLPFALLADLSGLVTEHRAVDEAAGKHGYGTCWSTAVTTAGSDHDLGLFVIFRQDDRAPTADDRDFLNRVSHLAAAVLAGTASQEMLARQALHDALTDLPNRSLLVDRLTQAVGRLRRSRGYVAVLFLDLDRFKVVNDSLGHAAGDRLLQTIAHRLTTVLRPGDTAARFGGDEFTLLCENLAGPEAAVAIAKRVSDAVRQPVDIDGTEIMPTTSVGIALTADPAESPEALIRNADAAMYSAKEQGRARFELFDDAMRGRAMERLTLDTALRRALDRAEFELVYQPSVNIRLGRITAVEALVRWRHPERGLLRPAQFLGLAEDTSLIVPIGRWVLDTACAQAVAWRRSLGLDHPIDDWNESLTMRVNLSRRELLRPGLVDDVEGALQRSGLPAAALCVEVTEGALAPGEDGTAACLRALKELGVRIAVDDFGTSATSLRTLTVVPVDSLKVDGAIVAGLGADLDDTAIVRAVVNLAHSLGLEAAAEAVERADQLELLRELGCDDAQGFHLAPPLAAGDVGSLLATDPRY
jgi:diguanylate cyclase (GGDEF)-like protein